MANIHIGKTIEYLRKLRKLTQQQLAEGICTREYIRRLERGDNQPTLYILDLLSQRLQEDIYNYHLLIEKHNNIETHIKVQEINGILESENYKLLEKTITDYEELESFKDGESLQVIYYSKALCSYYLRESYDEAMSYCIMGLKVYKNDFDVKNWKSFLYSKIELKLINSIASCQCYKNNTDIGIKMFYELFDYLNKYVSGTLYSIRALGNFHVTLYTQVAYNLSIHLVEQEKFNEALELINQAITISLRTKFVGMYPYLLEKKFQLLYMLEDYENSKIYYEKALVYYEDLCPEDSLKNLIPETKEEYSEIFNID